MLTPSDWIAIIGIGAGLMAFLAGLLQYRKAQQWKRAEFVAAEIKEMLADDVVQLALRLLDWNDGYYPLQTEPDPHAQVRVDDAILGLALRPHSSQSRFSPTEVRIREIFDALLTRLQRLEHFVESGLVTAGEIRPYLQYWIHLIGSVPSARKPEATLHAMWRYIDFYGYSDVQFFLHRFGYDIRSFGSSAAQKDIAPHRQPPEAQLPV